MSLAPPTPGGGSAASTMNTYVVVTDPGVDDSVALALLDVLAPGLPHALLPTFGNAPLTHTARNAREVIAQLSPAWRLRSGIALPANGVVEHAWPDYFHGPDGLWGVHPAADTSAVARATDADPAARLISLGPMSGVLPAMRRDASVAVMGGAFDAPGNETAWAETNFAFDADAAAEFFACCEGAAVRVVPLDVTRRVAWTRPQVAAAPADTPVRAWLRELLLAWFDHYGTRKGLPFHLHDPLTVLLAFEPQHARWTRSGVAVVTRGEQRGRTVRNPLHPPCDLALDMVDVDAAQARIFDLVFGTAGTGPAASTAA